MDNSMSVVVVGLAIGIPAVVSAVVLGYALLASIRSNNLNFGTAARHLERRYRAADDHLMRLAEVETCNPEVAAQLHVQERSAQSSRDAMVERAAIDAAAEKDGESVDLRGGVGSVDE